jgi:hypothetical protein
MRVKRISETPSQAKGIKILGTDETLKTQMRLERSERTR